MTKVIVWNGVSYTRARSLYVPAGGLYWDTRSGRGGAALKPRATPEPEQWEEF